jgi:predicted phosphodiesterase
MYVSMNTMKSAFKVLILWGGIVAFLIAAFFVFWYVNFKKNSGKNFQPSVLSTPTAKTKIATLGILADIHSSWPQLEKAIQILNQQKPDAVLVLGDMTDLGSLEDLQKAKQILAGIQNKGQATTIDGRPTGQPYLIIPGNHDVWYSRHEGKTHDFNFLQVFGAQPTCESLGNINLVLIDNSDENKQIPVPEWQKIEQCLNKNQPLIFFSHEPLYHPANDLVMGKYSDAVATQAAILRNELCNQKAELVVAGHLHSFSKYFYNCPNGYQLPMMVVPAITQARNFQSPRFLMINIFSDGSFEEREVVLD